MSEIMSGISVLGNIDNMEDLINIVLMANPGTGNAPVEPSMSFGTPFGTMTVNLKDLAVFGEDHFTKKLGVKKASATPIGTVISDTIGEYKDMWRRTANAAKVAGGDYDSNFNSASHWVFEGNYPKTHPAKAGALWKVYGTANFELP